MVNFHASNRKSENLHFDGLLLSKAYIKFQMYKTVMSHDTDEWCKVWRKTDSWFQKWHEELGNNFNALSGKSENLDFDMLLLSKVYYVCTKKGQRVTCYSTEEWSKIWRRTDLYFENDMMNLANFDPTLESLKISTLTGSFWLK